MRTRSGLILAFCFAALAAPAALYAQDAADDLEDRIEQLEAEVKALRTDAPPRRGAKLFRNACGPCHGASGLGDGPGADDLTPAPRNLSTREFRFRTTPSGAMPRPDDLKRTIREGLPGSAMPAFGKLFSEDELDEIVAFIYSIQDRPIDIDAPPEPLALPAALAEDQSASVEDGRALYLLLGCWRCHGDRGNGKGPSAKALTDDNGKRIHSTNFRHDPFKGGREAQAIVRTLLTGLNGSPMPAYGEAMMIAGDEQGDTASLVKITEEDNRNLERFLQQSPTRRAIDGMSPDEQRELRDRRLWALAEYLLSLDRRRKLGFRAFKQEPELEPRAQ